MLIPIVLKLVIYKPLTPAATVQVFQPSNYVD